MENKTFAFEIVARPDFSLLKVQIPAGKTIKVEAGAMAGMDTNIKVKAKAKGGLGRLLTGESIFISEYTAEKSSAEMLIAPGASGEIQHVHLNGETIYLQNSAFLAASPEIQVETKWQGVKKGFFSGQSFFLIKCSGVGDLWFNTYGGMLSYEEADEELVVDTGHIVAFTEGLTYEVSSLGGYKSLFFSGEGFVCKFRGKGRLWIQTKKVSHFARWLYWYRPASKNS